MEYWSICYQHRSFTASKCPAGRNAATDHPFQPRKDSLFKWSSSSWIPYLLSGGDSATPGFGPSFHSLVHCIEYLHAWYTESKLRSCGHVIFLSDLHPKQDFCEQSHEASCWTFHGLEGFCMHLVICKFRYRSFAKLYVQRLATSAYTPKTNAEHQKETIHAYWCVVALSLFNRVMLIGLDGILSANVAGSCF